MSGPGKVAVVTGANQGLGFALAEGLAAQLDVDDVVYLTGRDPARVKAAAERLVDRRAEVRAQVLDVRDNQAVDALASEIRERHGAVDIVFSNAYARITPEQPSADVVAGFVDTNNLGAARMLRAFGAILRPGGRLLVVASSLGSLRQLPRHLHARFETDVSTLEDVDATMLGWRDLVIAGRADQDGWPDWINIPSKVGQVAAVRVLARARQAADARDGTLVAAVCPGLIDTDSSRPWFTDTSSAPTPARAAVPLLRLALDRAVDQRFYGELVQFGQVIPWR